MIIFRINKNKIFKKMMINKTKIEFIQFKKIKKHLIKFLNNHLNRL